MQATTSAGKLCHTEVFDAGNPLAERNTRWAIVLTAITMVAEISGGWTFNSMALLADGWHMSSHALALGMSALAYAAARRFAQDGRFAFGTWKIEILGGYTSAILLVGVAAVMLFQSVERLIFPSEIHYNEAIIIAFLGLLVNLACAWLLKDQHHHHTDGEHDHHAGEHSGSGHHHDLNQRSAYMHVIADAATSALAIIALTGGKFLAIGWLDPVMGIVGAALVTIWAYGLLRDTGRVLLDAEMDAPVVAEVREVIAALPQPAKITDLHVWRVGRGKYACIVSINTEDAMEPDEIRRQLAIHDELAHVTVEITTANTRTVTSQRN